MGEEGKVYSDIQRDVIYRDSLQPLKIKISQIILYDAKTAMQFLQQYNEILECTNDKEILPMIAKLELQISQYERNDGSQKFFEYNGKMMIQKIKELQNNGKRLSLEDFTSEFNILKQRYDADSQKYSLAERDAIEKQIYELYGNVMLRCVKEGYTGEHEVSKDDIVGLTIYINNEIGILSQNKNPQVQNMIERIRMKLSDPQSAFEDDEIWKMLNYCNQPQNSIIPKQTQLEPMQSQSNALTVVQEKKGLMYRIKKYFQSEPQLPLQIEDVEKINLDWLAKHIPEDMLKQIEEHRLDEEGRTTQSKYLPDSKTAIYDFIGNQMTHKKNLKFENYEFEQEYKDNAGNKNSIVFRKITEDESWMCYIYFIPKYLDSQNRENMTQSTTYPYGYHDLCYCRYFNLMQYADFLDNIFATNLKGELGNALMKLINGDYDDYNIDKKSKVYRSLNKSFETINAECEKTQVAFRSVEGANRRAFYDKMRFSEEIKVLPNAQVNTHKSNEKETESEEQEIE